MLFFLASFSIILLPANLIAQTDSSAELLKNCSYYRAKRDAVPVYQQPDAASERIGALEGGEYVCYVGEQQGFAILDWQLQGVINKRSAEPDESAPELAFARLTDLWEGAPQGAPVGSEKPAQSYWEYIRSGGLPEDVYAPFRWLLGPWMNQEPKCRAGKICRELEEQDTKEPKARGTGR